MTKLLRIAGPLLAALCIAAQGTSTLAQSTDAMFLAGLRERRLFGLESNYRVLPGRENRAIAGLSMGGAQTLNIGFDKLADYGYIGVFSSGVFGIAGGFGGGAPNTDWEDKRAATLDDAELKKGLKLVWFACGKDDFLLQTNNATVAMLKKHGFDVVSRETDGGHTWIKWRDYLNEFAPQLFTDK